MVRALRVVFRGDGARLLMQVAHKLDALGARQRLVQVHRPSAHDQEDVLDAEALDELKDVIRELHAAPFNRKSTISRTAPFPLLALVTKSAASRTLGLASAGAAAKPAASMAAKSFTSSPMKQISSSARPLRWANARRAVALSLQPLVISARFILAAKRSTRGLSSPEIRVTIRPALRASDTPMMSANENRFHSWPSGPHQTPPSVSTPSTSSAMALNAAIFRRRL